MRSTSFLRTFVCTTLLILLPGWAAGQASSASFTLKADRIGAGGGAGSSASFTNYGAHGQAVTGPSESSTFIHGAGFIYNAVPGGPDGPYVFVVTTTNDSTDFEVGDGVCDTNDTAGDGPCSLRAAIQEANATANTSSGPDEIHFDISGSGPHVIQLSNPPGALPDVTDPVVIDGTTEPDYSGSPVVEVEGSNTGSSAAGVTLGSGADGSSVRALSITNFPSHGIEISAQNNLVDGCYIGLRPGGSAAGNGSHGIRIVEAENQIGQASGMGNVVSANGSAGISLAGPDAVLNTVAGNYIGTNPAGDALLGNSSNGVEVVDGGASNTIGGTASGAENIIAGNRDEVSISGSENIVQGNFLGTNANGDDLGSSFNAISIDSGSENQIGGSTSGAGNVMGFAHTNSVTIDGTGNAFQGNYIGVMPNGTELAGIGTGIRLFGTGQTVGGIESGEGNTITNQDWGVSVESGVGHTIRGNSIYANSDLGIDYNRDGVTPNDSDDSDDGVNRLQNFPAIQSADYEPSANEVSVTYLVSSDPNASGSGASAYPLDIDFYKADADNQEGKAYLGSTSYLSSDYSACSTPPCPKTVVFTPSASVTQDDDVVATATDFDGNTSEFSAPESEPLPVELTSFNAQAESETVQLSWRTASETNNAGFEVQRKADGSAWTKLGFVNGHGTTTESQTYSYEDADLPYEADSLQYRLKQVDLDGASNYSKSVAIALGVPDQLALHGNFPNPVQHRTTIRYELPTSAPVRVSVYNVLGQHVATLVRGEQEAGRHEATFRPRGLTSGVYIVRLASEGTVQTQKMTVVR